MLRFGVVGAGSIAREFSLRYLIPANGVEVVGIVDVNLDAARSLAEDVGFHRAGAVIIGTKYRETVDRNSITKSNDEIPQVMFSTNLCELLPLVDCIYVATPPSTHADLVAQVLSAQKQIILEKPLAVSLEDCNRIVNLSQEALNDGLFVGINIGMRYNAALHEMKRLIENTDFGQIEHASLRLLFRQWPREWQRQPWVAQRQEGGPLLEVGTHWVFGILELFGHNHYHSTHSDAIEYPDGANGILCESRCSGMIEFQNESQRVAIDVTIETTSDEAQSQGKDIYELIVKGSSGKTYVLYDFTRLREEEEQDGNRVERDLVTNATYGRHECVIDCRDWILNKNSRPRDEVKYVTPEEARNAQRIIETFKGRCA
jgi:predicted dehydrogenase